MNKEEVLDYLRNANLKEVTPEEIIHNLLQNREIQLLDYLELQKEIEEAKKPLLEIKLDPEQMIWDTMKWLECLKTSGVIYFSSSSAPEQTATEEE